jgi:hypothetical protein
MFREQPRSRIQRLRDWRWRKPLTLLLLLGLLLPAGVVSQVASSPKISVAEASICKTRYATWDLKGSDISTWPTVAQANFGALICVDGGRIVSVSPYLHINRTSTGVAAGFSWDNNGARVTAQTSTYVEVTGTAKSRVCYGVSKFQLCSSTTSETYRMRYYSVYGPYPTSTQPGIIGVYRWCSLTGCQSGNLVKRTSTVFPFI